MAFLKGMLIAGEVILCGQSKIVVVGVIIAAVVVVAAVVFAVAAVEVVDVVDIVAVVDDVFDHVDALQNAQEGINTTAWPGGTSEAIK